MAILANQVILNWVDISGKFSTNFCVTQDQGDGGTGAYGDLAAKFQAASHCALVGVQFQTTLKFDATPEDGDYPSVLDRAVLLARIPLGTTKTRVEVPGPRSELFQADTLTVDLSNTLVTDLQAACIAVLGDTSGHPMGPFRYGNRQRARLTR
jgi:hypothetical protein